MDDTNLKSLAVKSTEYVTQKNAPEVLMWLNNLLTIRNSHLSTLDKTKKAIGITKDRKVIFPVVKIIYGVLYIHIKNFLWDKRSIKGKLGSVGMLAGLTIFSGQNAGIAALGGAVGVPLWVVLGAGGVFAGHFIEEINKKNIQIRDAEIINVDLQEIADEASKGKKDFSSK